MTTYNDSFHYAPTGSTLYRTYYGNPPWADTYDAEYYGCAVYRSVNFIGNYVAEATLDLTSASNGLVFMISNNDADYQFYPAMQIMSPTSIQLGYAYYANVGLYPNALSNQGDFNGQTITIPPGAVVTFTRLQRASSYGYDCAARVVVKYGTTVDVYSSPWTNNWYYSYPIRLGTNYIWSTSTLNRVVVSSLRASDNLDISVMDISRLYDYVPLMSPMAAFPDLLPGNYGSSLSITLNLYGGSLVPDSQDSCGNTIPGDEIWYTLDGSFITSTIGQIGTCLGLPVNGNIISSTSGSAHRYTGPFTIPFVPNQTVKLGVLVVLQGSSTSPSNSNGQSFTSYSFVMPVPQPTQQSYPYPIDAAPMSFDSPDPAFEIKWTYDGSDPKTNGIVWTPGQLVPYGIWQAASPLSPYGMVQIRAASYDAANDAYSAESNTYYQFACAPVSGVAEGGVEFNAVHINLSCATPGSRIYYFKGTENPGSVTATEVSNPGSISIPWEFGAQDYVFYSTTADGSLIGIDQNFGSIKYVRQYVFKVGPPIISPSTTVSMQPTQFTLTPQTAGSTMYYTTDGTVPDSSSSLYTGPVMLQPGQRITAIALLNGSYSDASFADLQSEFEVLNVASAQLGSVRYHYYESVQRCKMLTELGCAQNVVNFGTNVSTDSVSLKNDNGQDASIHAWETEGSVKLNLLASNGPLNALTVRNGSIVRHWSRFCFNTAFSVSASIPFTQMLSDWLTNSFAPLSIVVASRVGRFTVSLTNAGTNIACLASIDWQGHQNNTPNSTVPITTPTIDSNLVLGVNASSNTITISVNGTQIVSHAADLTVDWWVEICTGADGGYSSVNVPTSIPCVITTISNNARLRRAPLALLGSFSTVAAGTAHTNISAAYLETVDFNQPFDTVDFVYGNDDQNQYGLTGIGYSRRDQGLLVNNAFGVWAEYLKWSIDPSFDFSVEVDLNIKTPTSSLQSSSGQNSSIVQLQLESPGSSQNTSFSSASGVSASYSIVVDSDNKRSYFGRSSQNTQRINFRHDRDVKLKISKFNGAIHAYGQTEGTWIDLGTITPLSTGPLSINLKFQNGIEGSNVTRFTVRSMKISGTLVRNYFVNAYVSGIEMMVNGISTGFTDATLTSNSSTMVLKLDRATGQVSTETMQFEPTDAAMALGVYESDLYGISSWTPLVSSHIIHCRAETASGLSNGYMVGVGRNLRIEDGVVKWDESGAERNALIGDISWHAPINCYRGFSQKRMIRAIDRHNINVSLVSGRS